MKIKSILLSLCSVIILAPVYAQDHSSFPVDVTSGPSPYYFTAGNRLRLCYELHLVNYAPFSVLVSQLRIADRKGKIISLLDSNALNDDVVGANHILNNDTDTTVDKKLIKPGMAAIIFVDITLPKGSEAPFVLEHSFRFNFRNSAGKEVEKEMPGPPISVHRRPAMSISPPVRGRGWIAFNAYGGGGHRRSYNPVDGRLRIAERFAIDFMKAGSDDRLFKTDPAINSNFYGYGQPVLAVADATVVEVNDGQPDRTGTSDREKRVVTLDNIVGNYVMLDLGKGIYAIYAHLQPGKIRVHKGEKVKTGEILGLLGNSGNSDEPHLHFQLMDKPSPLGSEGIPFVMTHFTQLGIAANTDAMDGGAKWESAVGSRQQIEVKEEFPVENAVINFK